MALEEEDQAAFDDEEDDLEDTDDSDMEEDFDDDETAMPAMAAQPLASDPNSSVPSTSTNPNPNPSLTNPTPPQNGTVSVPIQSLTAVGSPDPTWQRTEEKKPPPVTPPPMPPAAPPPSSASLDESRRLFQRLWTDEDEIKILNGFLEFTSSRGTTFASHQYDTGPFYEQIKNQLQLDFNKNQLIEKLRRLKKKYRNTASRMASHGREFAFKSPHEKSTYEIARKIWSASIKRSRHNSDDDDLNPYANSNSAAAVSVDRQIARSRRRGRKRALDTIPIVPAPVPMMPALPALVAPPVVPAGTPEGVVKVEVQTAPAPIIIPMPPPPPSSPVPPPALPSIVEETVKSCMSPIFKELLTSVASGPGIGGGLGFGLMGLGSPPVLSFGGNLVNLSDARWKQQQIMELEVYLKRVELVRDQIKSTLEELKSSAPVPASES